MVLFHAIWKNYGEIKLIKKQNGLVLLKNYKSSTLTRSVVNSSTVSGVRLRSINADKTKNMTEMHL